MSDNKGSSRKKAIVVGAGVGGTATAARLAHAGLDVEVYEKNEFSGGRCSLIHHDGYRFDQVSQHSQYDPYHHHSGRDTMSNLAQV
jgi:phytoene desaturase (3,4-didehydrolycopene-forming)